MGDLHENANIHDTKNENRPTITMRFQILCETQRRCETHSNCEIHQGHKTNNKRDTYNRHPSIGSNRVNRMLNRKPVCLTRTPNLLNKTRMYEAYKRAPKLSILVISLKLQFYRNNIACS